VPVEAPDLPRLEWTMDGDVKVFRIRAEVVRREFLPGRTVNTWGFNGSMPGPLVEVTEGDRVRFVVENALPEDFAMHWHGLEIPYEMDGVPGLEQDPIPPGGSFTYEFTLTQNGTYFYHSHMAMQEMMGLVGPLVIHPRVANEPPVDRDFVVIWQEWALLPNNDTPNTMSMEFNWLTINGKTGPDCTPMLAKQGERIRIRNINLGMDHHPIHLHGNQFVVTGTEAGRKPESTWFRENTIVLGVAQARDLEFTAEYVGAWMLHCHLPHHMMSGMASMVGPMMGVGRGVDTGAQEGGMGMIVDGSNALSDELGPKLGRTLAVGSTGETAVTNAPIAPTETQAPPAGMDQSKMGHDMSQMDHSKMGHDMSQMQHGAHHEMEMSPGVTMAGSRAPNANEVPGYPQDMAIVMDDLVAKPETVGLRKTWTMGMMGMMTMIRVLRSDELDAIERSRATWQPNETQRRFRALQQPAQTGEHHHHPND
jgi:hypothetical protein